MTNRRQTQGPEVARSISKIRCFLGWFEDNFSDERYLLEVEHNTDGTIHEQWISYMEHPEYLGACEALEELQKTLTNPS